MDVTVTGTAGVVFRSIASEDITLTRDDNYTLSANKIQLEDLNGKAALTLTVTARVNADADIAVMVVNIPEKAAGTAVNIRPHIAYYDGEGAVQYIYGAMLTRSVQDVLTAAA